MLGNLSLRAKLGLAIVVIGLLVSGVNIYQIKLVDEFHSTSEELIEKDVKRLDLLQEADFDNSQLHNESEHYNNALKAKDAAAQAELKSELNTNSNSLRQSIQTYRDLVRGDENAPNDSQLTDLYKLTNQLVGQVQAILNQGDEQSFTAFDISTEQTDTLLAGLIHQERTTVAKESAEMENTVGRIKATFVGMTAGVTLAAICIGIVLASSIARSLARLKVGAMRIANGDFSAPIPVTTKDEIGQLSQTFNQMAERMRDSYRRLAIEQQRDEAILQSMGEGLIATDEQGRILLINAVASRYLDIVDDAVAVGKPIQEVYQLYDVNDKDEKPLAQAERPVFAALSTGQAVNGVFGFHRSGDKKSLMSITATPIKLNDSVVGAISVMRDVTKEKEIDRMKTEFISLASHQLRTPLSAIKWFTEMLVSGDAGNLTPEQLEFANNIDDSTQRMIALVNALLNISRIESGRIMVDPKPTDLRELVDGIINDLKAKTEEKQQTLIISVHDDLPKINLDPRLIGQVYLNLLTNAVKYTPKGGEISVFISKKDDQIISQVTDNGYGIPKDQQDRIFQKFFRAANAVKVETDGTGLGLYLIKAVIESSGGKIWFESDEGKGTTFWFSIPLTGMKAKEGEVTLDA